MMTAFRIAGGAIVFLGFVGSMTALACVFLLAAGF